MEELSFNDPCMMAAVSTHGGQRYLTLFCTTDSRDKPIINNCSYTRKTNRTFYELFASSWNGITLYNEYNPNQLEAY